jgi:hypothetical protein
VGFLQHGKGGALLSSYICLPLGKQTCHGLPLGSHETVSSLLRYRGFTGYLHEGVLDGRIHLFDDGGMHLSGKRFK